MNHVKMEANRYYALIIGMKLKLKNLELKFCEDKRIKFRKNIFSLYEDIDELITDYNND